MSWKETLISALKGEGTLELALKTAVKADPEEVYSVLENFPQDNQGYLLNSAAFFHELGISYYHTQEFFLAERALGKALEIYKALAHQTSVDMKKVAGILTNLGILYSAAGRFEEAETSFKKALDTVKQGTSETQELDTALISINLGLVYQNTQQFTKAEKVLKNALETLRKWTRRTPEYTADIALILMNLGLLYWNTKRFSEAEKVYTEALEKYRHLVRQNPDYLINLATTLSNVGILYQNTQRFTEAEKVLNEALEIQQGLEKTLDVYVGLADTCANLGNLYWTTKQFSKAEKAFTKSLEMRRELSEKTGGYALDVVLALTNLGNLYKDTRKFSEAENVYTEALETCRRLAEENPEVYTLYVALILNNLGILYNAAKKVDKAEGAYAEALQIRRALAEKNPVHTFDVAMTLSNAGLFYRNVGRYSEAEQAYKEALEYYNRGDRTAYLPDIARILNNLGILYRDMQEFPLAEKMYKEALDMYEDLEKGNKRAYILDIAGTLDNLGDLYRDTKRFDKAEKMYNRSLELYKNLEKEDPEAFKPNVASVLNDIGLFYQDTRRVYEAEKAYKGALKRRMELAGKDPETYAVDYAGTLNNLGMLYNDAHLYGKERFDEAENMYKKALETFERVEKQYPEVFTPHVAGMLNNLGALYKDTDRFAEAEEAHKKALELRMSLAQENPEVFAREVADSLLSLGLVNEKAGKMDEAEKYYQEAFETYKELGLWFDAANTCYNLSQVKSDRKILDKARKLIEIAILFSREEKYKYAQKGTYETIYWGLLHEDVSSFSVLETLRDPELLSLPWDHMLSDEELERAQEDIECQKEVVDTVLYEDIPSITILEGLPKGSLFIYVQNLQDYVLFFVIGRFGVQRIECKKEFLTIGDKLLYTLKMQRGAAEKTDELTIVTNMFDKYSRKWSETLPGEIKGLIQENDYIIFSPDPYCSYLPLEALQINGEPLCIKKMVVRATSLHQFLDLSKRKPRFDSSLIVGNPWPHCREDELIYSLPDANPFKISFLHGAQQEAETLTGSLPEATLLLGQKATGDAFLSAVSKHPLIHFSGHGSLGRILFLSGPFSGFPPLFEPKEFSDLRIAERSDGKRINMMEEWHPVTDLDLFDVKLTEGAVIFLNACETGQHRYAGGGYYQGLPAVFLKNGAHSVVSSLVPIFDKHSKEFALHFYEILLRTHSVSQSLEKTRIWARNEYNAQIYWVPYIHYGPPL